MRTQRVCVCPVVAAAPEDRDRPVRRGGRAVDRVGNSGVDALCWAGDAALGSDGEFSPTSEVEASLMADPRNGIGDWAGLEVK